MIPQDQLQLLEAVVRWNCGIIRRYPNKEGSGRFSFLSGPFILRTSLRKSSKIRHPGEGRGPECFEKSWIPAFAGMTLWLWGDFSHKLLVSCPGNNLHKFLKSITRGNDPGPGVIANHFDVARGQGHRAQKASAGKLPLPGSPLGFRKMRRVTPQA